MAMNLKSLKSLLKDDKGNVVLVLVGIAIALMILAVIFAVGPVIGYNVDSTQTWPSDMRNASQVAKNWYTGESGNTAITNGSELWAQNTPMIAVAALVAIVGVIIAVLMLSMAGRRG